MKPLQELIRPNIWKLSPYSLSQIDHSGHSADVFLDANENPYNKPYNRYPDPLQSDLKKELAFIKSVPSENMVLGNGSDEVIDLIYKVFCEPGVDNVIAIDPTYEMYRFCADVNNVEYRSVLLDDNFQINVDQVLNACDHHTKVIWICTPNNPTGNNLNHEDILSIIHQFEGIVVIDEAYSDFSSEELFRSKIDIYPNIIVLNTMSVAWASAGIRLGMAFANTEIAEVLNKVRNPYNINTLTQQHAIDIIQRRKDVEKWATLLLQERNRLMNAFSYLPTCQKVYPSDANFFLVRMTDAQTVYDYLVSKGIIVQNCNNVSLCRNCLRITVGTKSENTELLAALRQYP